jgi:hypothetical protein
MILIEIFVNSIPMRYGHMVYSIAAVGAYIAFEYTHCISNDIILKSHCTIH